MTERLALPWGWSRGLVPGLRAAWGARWIVTQDGMVDQLWDRQGFAGDEQMRTELVDWFSTELGDNHRDHRTPRGPLYPLVRAAAIARYLLMDHIMRTREAAPFVLHQDSKGAVIGNTNASAGYLYTGAFLFAHLPEGHKTKGLEIALGLVGEDMEPLRVVVEG